ERLVALLEAQDRLPGERPPHAYLVLAGAAAETRGLLLAEQWRAKVPGLRLQANLGGGSLKSQFKRADRSGAALALVLGDDELAAGTVTVRFLREKREQQALPVTATPELLARLAHEY